MKTRAHTTRRPARPGITPQRSQITGYLAGAVGTAALLGAPQAEAAVTAVNFGFGTEYTLSDGIFNHWTVGPGFGTIYGHASTNYFLLGNHLSPSFFYHTASGNALVGLPGFFANGTVSALAGTGR